MEILLTNKNTGTVIRNTKIVKETDAGLTLNDGSCWTFIPSENIRQDNIYSDYYTAEQPATRKTVSGYNPYLAQSEQVKRSYQEKLECRFGFKDLVLSTRKSAPASAILSNEIDVSRADRITIDCDVENKSAGSVEIYIVDHNDEIPILFNQSLTVRRERLFFGEDTRFPVNTEKKITLYEDNKKVTRDYLALTAKDFQKHVYTLTYVADGNYTEYEPLSDFISIKVVLRQYKKSPLFTVNNLIVHKYGEAPVWNLQR